MLDSKDGVARHKLDVNDFHLLGTVGILGPEDRVELIDGELIDMAPIGPDHAATVNGFNEKLVLAFAGRAIVSVQNPVRLDQFSELQPDFAVARLRADRYRGRHAEPADLLLLIEVADSSVRFDRTIKLPRYAGSGVPEFWLVDLRQRVVEAHRKPVDGAYTELATYRSGDTVALLLAPEIELTLTGIFD